MSTFAQSIFQPSVPAPPPFTVPASYNALAPQWMTGYCETDTPDGWEDFRFVYVTSNPSYVPLTAAGTVGAVVQNGSIPLDSDSEFWWSEVEFSSPPTVLYSGGVLVRFRDGLGLYMMTDYILIDDINGPLGPCFQVCRPGDSIYFDLQNTSASPNSIQIQLKGFRRRKQGA